MLINEIKVRMVIFTENTLLCGAYKAARKMENLIGKKQVISSLIPTGVSLKNRIYNEIISFIKSRWITS